MAEPDSRGPRERHHHHDERPNLRATVGNLRGTGRPWRQVFAQVVSNFRLKVSARRSCCGNYGQPGC